MEIGQKKNSNKISFVFGEEELNYRIEDGSGSRSFSVEYRDISRERQTLVERNAWLRNAGLLWVMLGVVMTGLSLSNGDGLKLSIWLWLGAACYGLYHFRSTRFTLVPTDKGNLYVIDDADGPRVLQEIASRRADHFRREYDFMPESETPDQLRKRFTWLHREGALSEEELQQRLAAVDAADPARMDAMGEPGMRLN
jgi:hypothetical protein